MSGFDSRGSTFHPNLTWVPLLPGYANGTVAHNCHIKTECHIKFKSLTSNSNHSNQIQITHSKFKSLTANSNCSQQITIPLQQITNLSHQIQIVHIKYKSLTANTNEVSVKRGLRSADCGLRSRGKSRLRVKGRLQTKGKIQNGDRRLGVKCRMKD